MPPASPESGLPGPHATLLRAPRRRAAPRWTTRLARGIGAALLACAILGPGPGLAEGQDRLGALGLLWPADAASAKQGSPLVVVLHDATGIDTRGWLHGDQIRAAGIAVLHAELLETTEDGPGQAAQHLPAAALARLTLVVETIAADPRFAGSPVGILALGDSGLAAMLVAADPRLGGRIAALVLLYPGCAALDAALGATGRGPRSAILLQHGDTDPANPPADCARLERGLARSAAVRRLQYAGAGFAWDLRPLGLDEVRRLPWPGRAGERLPVAYWPEGAALAASRSASFFAATFAARRP